MLPMVPAVYAAVKARHEQSGAPEEGWLFPSASREGHFNKDTAKDQHKKAIDEANKKAKQNKTRDLEPFEPYVLRHGVIFAVLGGIDELDVGLSWEGHEGILPVASYEL